MINSIPYLINFQKIGEPSQGYIAIAEESKSVPFDIKRVFWTFRTPEDVIRGGHAHHNTQMILIAAEGKIEVETEMPGMIKDKFVLDSPNQGLYLPTFCWHTMKYSSGSVQLVMASSLYQESDYIRSYDIFLSLKNE